MRRGVVGAMVLTVGIGCSATVSDEPSAGADHGEDHLLPAIEATDPDAPPVRHRQLRVSLRPPDGDPGGPGPDRRTVGFRVYDPVDQVSRTRGLMGVTDLPDDAGMLFRFATPRTGGFWMKNTVLPLSIAYAGSDGVISSIVDMQPCRADPCPSYPPDAPYRIALEVNRGQFDVRGVTPGWRIELPDDLPPPPDG
ncbi:DUF192 domain-containing protein [Mycolicibacterium thermoresistibile]